MKIHCAVMVSLLIFARSSPAADAVDYLRDVKPILAERCFSCHGAIRQKGGLRLDTAALIRRGGERGPVIEAGKSGESALIDRVEAGATSADRMPPPSEGVALGDREIAILREWIDQGAVAPVEAVPADPRRHWAYVPPARAAVPSRAKPGWSSNPIDAFLAAGHQAKGLIATAAVRHELLLRRVYLDLVGLPPTPRELDDFRRDRSPAAYEKVVDQLLASPRHGERWGRHWMDVWRYSDWYGLGEEARYSHRHLWHWRDWIIAALNADKGYDRMVVEMLAGDELAPDDTATVRATGYLVRNWDIFNRNAWLANTVEHTARAFLGITIGCARCHDHKFDPIAQSDYYRLRAFFEPVHIRVDRLPGQPDRAKAGLPRVFDDFLDTPTFLFIRGDESRPDQRALTAAAPAVLGGEIKTTPVLLPITVSCPDKRDFVVRETTEAGEREIAASRSAVAQAQQVLVVKTRALTAAVAIERASQLKSQISSGKTDAATRVWQQATAAIDALARARLEAEDAQTDLSISHSVLALAELRQRALLAVLRVERLEDDGAKKNAARSWLDATQQTSKIQQTLAVLEASHKCLIAQRTLDRARTPAQKKAAEVTAASTQLVECRKELLNAKNLAKVAATTTYTPRSLVYHRAKTSFRDEPSNKPYPTFSTGRRLALARWIVDRRNPLAARVAVNHIWMRHFGEPLVASTFDFGLRTKRPVHHEMLDWLAVEFMESGWSMKHLHRLIVTSQAYRMRSAGGQAEDSNARVDPDNQYLWRMHVRRMEAEVIRDSLLHLAGRLDSRMGGVDLPVASAETTHRRSIYYRYARGDRISFLTMFDAPNVEECYRRDETIVPQQALALTNSGVSLAGAAEIAAMIDSEVGEADAPDVRSAFVVSAFERVLGRTPSDRERFECAQALERLVGVFASESPNETVPHRKARAALVHILLNHNDFVSIR
jgi:hypothetical protein